MALSWNEIKESALIFTEERKGESRERVEKNAFRVKLFDIFWKRRKNIAFCGEKLKKLKPQNGFIYLHNPPNMSPKQLKVCQQLYQAVDPCYRLQSLSTELSILSFFLN